jgi:Fe-S-cluster containining protein
MMAAGKRKKTRKPKKKIEHDLCKECIPAKCCMYLSIEIDEPETIKDYDDLLWIIAHRGVEIYMDDDRWYVMVQNHCRFYDPEKRCLIYTKRPRICREHTWKECEFKDDYDFKLYFHNYEELERYIKNNIL